MGLILYVIFPLLPFCWAFSFALGCGVSFFGGIQPSPVDGCSAVSFSFGVLTGEDECTSFYSASDHRQQTLQKSYLTYSLYFQRQVMTIQCKHQSITGFLGLVIKAPHPSSDENGSLSK